MCLFYFDHLDQKGLPPDPLLDSNIASPGDNTARFLVRNYRGISAIGLLDLLRAKVGIPVVVVGKLETFRSQQLFEESTVDSALLTLAFHHGYLTYSDPSDLSNKARLVCPNRVYQDILLDAILETKLNAMKGVLGLSDTNSSNTVVKRVWDALKGKLEDYTIEKVLESLTPKNPLF